MSPYLKTILRDLGVLIHIPGLMALASLPVCLVFGETYAIVPFLVTAAAALAVGQGLFRLFRGAEKMRLRHAMDTAVLAWVATPAIGMIPFLLIAAAAPSDSATLAAFRDPWNAAFEAVSGFTSTGLSVTLAPSELPHALQWWRSFMQWIGGVGVIVLMLAVFHPTGETERLFFAEGREQPVLSTVLSSVQTIWWIYLLYTGAGIVLLLLAGMSWWEAVNYGMAGIATGGFGMTDNSLGDFAAAPRLVMVFIILMGAISFRTHYHVCGQGRVSALWHDVEVRLLVVLLVAGTLLVLFETRWFSGDFLWIDSLFQVASGLATAGFQTVDLGAWSPGAHLLLAFAMFVGGAAGSTVGGLKLRRMNLLLSASLYRIGRVALQPWRLMTDKPIGESKAERRARRSMEAAMVLGALWVAGIVTGTFALLHVAGPEYGLSEVLLEVTSALGNVGLSAGITGPGLHWSGKLILMVIMWMGRLEIIPVLVFFASFSGPVRRAHR